MNSMKAMAALRDAIRAELIAELTEKLEELHDSVTDQSYMDGVSDAISVLQRSE